jgi:hypothetical protein
MYASLARFIHTTSMVMYIPTLYTWTNTHTHRGIVYAKTRICEYIDAIWWIYEHKANSDVEFESQTKCAKWTNSKQQLTKYHSEQNRSGKETLQFKPIQCNT